MAFKIFKVLWIFSLLALLVNFFYIYASLPENVIILDSSNQIAISREMFFYSYVITLAVINVLVFVINNVFTEKQLDFKAWFYGLVIILNFFFIITISFVHIYNSNERYDYARLGGIIYGSVILIIIWAISWPLYSLSRKFFNKESV